MNREDNFFEWLTKVKITKNKKHMTEYTANRYAKALNIISNDMIQEGVIELSLYYFIDVNKAKDTIELIRKNKTFIKKNKNGHYMYNAALNHYIEYLNEQKSSYIPEEINENDIIYEGAKKLIVINKFERSKSARDKCIEHYGTKCNVCDLNLFQIYGEIAKNFIHVHHKKSLYEINEEYVVDPIKDLIPVCPNCHAILHLCKPAMSIEELKTIIKRNK